MSQEISTIIFTIIESVAGVLFTYLAGYAAVWLKNHVKNEKVKAILVDIQNTVTNSVKVTYQTYVENLKKENLFDKKAQVKALAITKEKVLATLTDDAKKLLTTNAENIEDVIVDLIEKTIAEEKK